MYPLSFTHNHPLLCEVSSPISWYGTGITPPFFPFPPFQPRKAHRIHGGTYLSEHKVVSREEFARQLRERLYAVSKDRETMTMRARDNLRQRGLSYEEIMSAQWYDLPEVCKYLQTGVSDIPLQSAPSQASSNLQQPSSSHHQLSPLEVHSPNPTPLPGLHQGSLEHVNNGMRDMEEAMRDWRISNHQVRLCVLVIVGIYCELSLSLSLQAHRKRHGSRQTNSGCSSVFSATSDSGVGGDAWASSDMATPTNSWGGSGDLSTPTNDRLHQYLHGQNIIAARQPERERMATSAAIALMSNSPHPESLNPLPGQPIHHHHSNERQRKHMPHHYSSGDDSSSAFTITSQSSTSDLFIPKRQPHMGADSEDQHYPGNM